MVSATATTRSKAEHAARERAMYAAVAAVAVVTVATQMHLSSADVKAAFEADRPVKAGR